MILSFSKKLFKFSNQNPSNFSSSNMLGFTPHTHNRILLAMEERANNQENCIDRKKKLQRLGSRHS